MSYDINFWKPKANLPQPLPVEIYKRITSNESISELEPLPAEPILSELRQAFSAFNPSEAFPTVAFPEGSMDVSHGPQSFRFDFYGPETGAEKARVWQIMSGFGCVCYDPQTDTLHTPENPPSYRRRTAEEVKQIEAILGGRDIASMMQHMQKKRARRALIGCGAVLAAGLTLAAAAAALVFYLVT